MKTLHFMVYHRTKGAKQGPAQAHVRYITRAYDRAHAKAVLYGLLSVSDIPLASAVPQCTPISRPYWRQGSQTPDCWLGFVRAAISDGWTVCACKAQPPQNRAHRSPGTRLKQSTYPKRRAGAVNLQVAHAMNQPEIGEVLRAPMFRGNHMVHMERPRHYPGVGDRLGIAPVASGPVAAGDWSCRETSPVFVSSRLVRSGCRGSRWSGQADVALFLSRRISVAWHADPYS